MTRFLVTFDDGLIEAESAKEAAEKAAQSDQYEIGHRLIVVNMDAAEAFRFRLGAEAVEET